LGIVWDFDFSVSFGWNHRLNIGLLNHFTQCVCIICFVGNDAIGSLPIQQVGGRGDVMRLAAGQNEAQRPAFCIGKGMNFGG